MESVIAWREVLSPPCQFQKKQKIMRTLMSQNLLPFQSMGPHVPDGSSSHERGTQSSACIIGVYSSTSDPVVVAPLSSQIPSVGAIKCEINSQRIAAESGAFNPSGKRSSKLKESQILEKNQPLEPSKDISGVAVCFLWNAGV